MGPDVEYGAGWSARFGGLLVAAMVSSSLLSLAVGALSPFITADLGLSRARVGALQSTVFLVAAVLSPVMGRACDLVSGRTAMLFVFGAASVALATAGSADSYAWLLAGAALAGVAQAVSNPATNNLLAADLPIRRRGYVIGIKQSGVQIGGFLAGALLPSGALLVGWGDVLHGAVLFPVLGMLVLPWVVPSGAGTRSAGTAPPARALPPLVRLLAAYAFLMGGVAAVIVTYLPLFGVETLHLDPRTAGMAAALVGLVGTVARIMLGGRTQYVADVRRPLGLLSAGAALSVLLVVGSEWAGAPLLWVGAAGVGLTAMSWNSVAAIALVRDMPSGTTGRASGLMQSAFYGGFIASPLLFGWIVDTTGRYAPGWLLAVMGAAGATGVMLRDRRVGSPGADGVPAAD